MCQSPVLSLATALYIRSGRYRQFGSTEAAAAIVLGGRLIEHPVIVEGRLPSTKLAHLLKVLSKMQFWLFDRLY